MAADAGGKLFFGSALGPGGKAEYLTQVFIGQAGDGKLRIGQGLKEFPVFAGYFQGADTAGVLKAWF